MNEHNDNRSPEEIESDIERTREDFSSTIDAIQHKLTPGQLMDQAVSYARTSLPADFGTNLGNTVRDNPVPVTLIGIGIAWLMASSRYSDGRARYRRQQADYDRVYSTEYTGATDATGSHEGRMHRAASKVSETGRDLKDRVSETSRSLKEKASDIGNRISEKTSAVTGRARDMTERARGMTQGAHDRMSETAGSTRNRMSQMSQRSQQQYYRAKDSFGHMVEEQPLMLGVLGVAVGSLLGAMLPSTRREDRLMGQTRDDLLETAKETARGQAETMKESAQRVMQTAKEEAGRVADSASSNMRAQGNGQASGTATSGGMDSSKHINTPSGGLPH